MAAIKDRVLTYEELFKIGFAAKTVRKYRVSQDGSIHILRLSSEQKDTLHGDMTLWLIHAEKSLDDIMQLWKDVMKEGERTHGRIAFYDLGDAKELPLVLEILLLSDGSLFFDCYSYGYRDNETAIGHLGGVIGNGFKVDLDDDNTEGMQGLIACILANHIGPKNEFLTDACERVDKVLAELEKQGISVHVATPAELHAEGC